MLFVLKRERITIVDGEELRTKVTIRENKIKFFFKCDKQPIGKMYVLASRGLWKILKIKIDKQFRPLLSDLLKDAAKIALEYNAEMAANLRTIIPTKVVEKRKRMMFIRYSKYFQDAGFKFSSTYTLKYTQKKKHCYNDDVLTKPIAELTYKDIKKPKSFWQSLDKKQLEEYKKRCFVVFRSDGFPHVSTSPEKRIRWLRSLVKTDINLIDDMGNICQNLTGLALAWSFHPHAWSVPCGKGFMTVLDAFNNDEKLRLLINRLIDYYPVMSKANLFGRIKMLSGVQAVSNFRPTAAAALYEYFDGGVVYDMSGGWGGRMLGAYRAPSVNKYIATEPSSLTYKGLWNQAEFLTHRKLFVPTTFDVYKMGSEVFRPDKHSIDFAFTSPPYFNCERYSNEKTQSYVKFNTYDAWLNGFLRQTFENVRYGLKPGRYMAINIANINGAASIERDTVKVAKDVGFKHTGTLYLLLSRAGSGFKREPVFIFQKRRNIK